MFAQFKEQLSQTKKLVIGVNENLENTLDVKEEHLPLIFYAVAASSLAGIGFSRTFDPSMLPLPNGRGFKTYMFRILKYDGQLICDICSTFANEMAKISPISKLKLDITFNNKYARGRLPSLSSVRKDDFENLQYAAEELLNPGEAVSATFTWRISRLRFHAIALIVKRMYELDAKQIAAYSLEAMHNHIKTQQESQEKDVFSQYFLQYVLFLKCLYSDDQIVPTFEDIQ